MSVHDAASAARTLREAEASRTARGRITEEWDGLDLETIRERATVRNAELEGFDRAYDEIC